MGMRLGLENIWDVGKMGYVCRACCFVIRKRGKTSVNPRLSRTLAFSMWLSTIYVEGPPRKCLDLQNTQNDGFHAETKSVIVRALFLAGCFEGPGQAVCLGSTRSRLEAVHWAVSGTKAPRGPWLWKGGTIPFLKQR